ncbi:MAG: secondary thiamine-phosphate synthase enzyme YjbQ [Candidatus Aenigmarchaeota archaeon]|nr:secondary thiamine-phosphate synthase enzyme YjbQ [Candidatus Aenigmarchaeota archaeon]
MAVETKTIRVSSKAETDIINITEQVSHAVQDSKVRNGIVNVFVPGSTASVSTIEFEPNLVKDFEDAIERLVPSDIKYRHTETWGDDNGKSHVRATLVQPGLTVPFRDKKLLLGQWQQLVLLDFDVPARTREVILQIIGE